MVHAFIKIEYSHFDALYLMPYERASEYPLYSSNVASALGICVHIGIFSLFFRFYLYGQQGLVRDTRFGVSRFGV